MAISVTAELGVICARFGVESSGVDPERKVGIARNVINSLAPVNGLRHKPEGHTCGWYIWAGKEVADALKARHREHGAWAVEFAAAAADSV